VFSQRLIGKDLPVAYASRTLNKAEIYYKTSEKELSIVVWGIKVFRPYLFGQQFNVITDHRALLCLFNLTDPGSWLTHWRLKLEEYQYTIHYKSKTSNTNVDALSRIHRVVTKSQKATKSTESLQISENPETSLEITPELSRTSENTQSRTENQTESLEELESPIPKEINEYQKFILANSSLKWSTANILEIQGNFFDEELSISLVICASADFKTARRVALTMRRKFGNTAQLRRLQKSVTEIASFEVGEKLIFYLITKEHYW